MGLDLYDLSLCVQRSFDITISDGEFIDAKTPRDLKVLLRNLLPESRATYCLSQRAFYKVRQVVHDSLGGQVFLKPETRWRDILAYSRRRATFKQIYEQLGIAESPAIGCALCPNISSIRHLVRRMVAYHAFVFKDDGEGWSDRDIDTVLALLLSEELGLESVDDDARFVEDLGYD